MANHLTQSRDKLTLFIQHAPMGLAEIDKSGTIIHINTKGEDLLKPILAANNIKGNNLYPVLEQIAPTVVDRIKRSADEAGNIVTNELHSFSFSAGGVTLERHYNLVVNKIFADCIIVGFDDTTNEYVKEKAIEQAVLDNAILQGKFEIAANILHDIGNVVVGFGSYLTRIKRSLELDNSDNIANLVGFFETNESAISVAIGEARAAAIVQILSGIAQTQKDNQKDISKSISEQHNIINHIQEILNIQRQYATGYKEQEKRPTSIRSIINDCLSMLFASFTKRGISVTIDIPDNLPLIKAERTKIMQVILNILKNSAEAIDVYAVEKSISLTAKVQTDLIILQLQDSGKGFDEVTGKKLFSRGFTTKATGSGIGLEHCKAILENHHATIEMASDGPGKGAQTTITFKI
jgi:signal transduction histidine kinase